MKKLLSVSVSFIIFAALQCEAAVTSLPIGSVEKVLSHEVANTYQVVLNVQAADTAQDIDAGRVNFLFMASWRSYAKADGTLESINALCRRSAATADKAELKTLLQTMMRAAVKVSVDPNDPALQGKVIAVIAVGEWQPDPTNWMQGVVTFPVLNEFTIGSLPKDPSGNQIIPESAYQADLARGITYMNLHGVFLTANVSGGEVKDGQGNVIDRAITASQTPNVLIFHNEILQSQPGTVDVRYGDGTTQTFSLAGGSLLYPPLLKIAPMAPLNRKLKGLTGIAAGMRVTVWSKPGAVNLEYADTVGGRWLPLATITNDTGSVEFRDTSSVPSRFYRARISGN